MSEEINLYIRGTVDDFNHMDSDDVQSTYIGLKEYPEIFIVLDHEGSIKELPVVRGVKYLFGGTMFTPSASFFVRGVSRKLVSFDKLDELYNSAPNVIQVKGKFTKFDTVESMRGNPVGFASFDGMPETGLHCIDEVHEDCLKAYKEGAEVFLSGELQIDKTVEFHVESFEVVG